MFRDDTDTRSRPKNWAMSVWQGDDPVAFAYSIGGVDWVCREYRTHREADQSALYPRKIYFSSKTRAEEWLRCKLRERQLATGGDCKTRKDK